MNSLVNLKPQQRRQLVWWSHFPISFLVSWPNIESISLPLHWPETTVIVPEVARVKIVYRSRFSQGLNRQRSCVEIHTLVSLFDTGHCLLECHQGITSVINDYCIVCPGYPDEGLWKFTGSAENGSVMHSQRPEFCVLWNWHIFAYYVSVERSRFPHLWV